MSASKASAIKPASESWCSTHLHSTIKHSFTWTIKNYRLCTYKCKTGKPLVSSPFTVAENHEAFVWRMMIYPEGDTEDNEDYVSVIVLLLSSLYGGILSQFKLSIIDSKQEDRNICESDIVELNEGETYTQEDFVRRDVLLEEQNGYLPDGDLTLHCEVTVFSETTNYSGKGNIAMFQVPESHLSDDMEKLLKNKEYSDVVLDTNGCKFLVHKAVLAMRSPVFAAMFKHEMEETKQNKVEITDVDSDVLKEMLFFVYTGKAPNLQGRTRDLLAAANKYALDRLKAMCEETLNSKLTVHTASDLLIFADQHNADQLKTSAIDFVVLHADEVMETADWKTVVKHHPTLVGEVCRALAKH